MELIGDWAHGERILLALRTLSKLKLVDCQSWAKYEFGLPDQEVNLKKFFAELKRRKVYTVAVTYAVVAWLLIQIVTQVFPPFEVPNWAERLVIVAIILGFPIALVFAWIYDFTRHGIVRTDDAQPQPKLEITDSANSVEKSIAVLPFNDLSPKKDHAYF